MRRRYLCHAIGHRRGPVCSWCGADVAMVAGVPVEAVRRMLAWSGAA